MKGQHDAINTTWTYTYLYWVVLTALCAIFFLINNVYICINSRPTFRMHYHIMKHHHNCLCLRRQQVKIFIIFYTINNYFPLFFKILLTYYNQIVFWSTVLFMSVAYFMRIMFQVTSLYVMLGGVMFIAHFTILKGHQRLIKVNILHVVIRNIAV